MLKKIITLLAFFLATTPLTADTIRLGNPGYGGTGCPGGSASVTLSPDQKSLSILFDQYLAQAGLNGSMDRKNCNIAIPVHVPNGYSISIFRIDYRGFVALPQNSMARFNVEYFFAGQRGPRYAKTWRGPATEDYLLRNKLNGRSMIWSACGADVNLRINSAMFVSSRNGEEALATVDSADVKSGLIYHFQFRRCRS